MLIAHTLSWYKRREVQEALVEHARDREIAVRYGDSFGKRPDVLLFPADVLEHAKQRATSFHASEERWVNPIQIVTGMNRSGLDKIRSGWDLVLDIDCAIFEYSRIAAHFTIEALKHHGITGISCKFSGNKGFHIGVPFEAFPETINGTLTKDMFPEAPRRIAAYIKHLIARPVADGILKFEGGDFSNIVSRTGLAARDITQSIDDGPVLNAEPFLVIDTILIAPRHLYRMPYSLHEKSGLVSLPIAPEAVLSFERDMASTETAKVTRGFLVRDVPFGEAGRLVMQAFDFSPSLPEDPKQVRVFEDDGLLIPETCFPPCIKSMLAGMEDGKKRALFVLLNFLRVCNWPNDKIEAELRAWNLRNREPLRDTILLGHIKYHLSRKEKVLPPNCDNELYYGAHHSCKEELRHQGVKNPVQFAKRAARSLQERPKRLKAKKDDDYHDAGKTPEGASEANSE